MHNQQTTLKLIDTTRPHNGVKAWEHAAELWEITPPLPESYTTAQEKKAALEEIAANTTAVSLATIVTTKPVGQWDKLFTQHAKDHARLQYINDGLMIARKELSGDLAVAHNDLYDSFFAALGEELDTTQHNFVEAVQQLERSAYDAHKAVEVNPVAFHALLTNGRKLAALVPLMQTLGRDKMTREARDEFAIMCTFNQPPELVHDLSTGEKKWTDDMFNKHSALLTAKDKARNLSQFLIEAAAGEYDDVTLDFARSREEYNQRKAEFRKVGAVHKIGEKKQTFNHRKGWVVGV